MKSYSQNLSLCALCLCGYYLLLVTDYISSDLRFFKQQKNRDDSFFGEKKIWPEIFIIAAILMLLLAAVDVFRRLRLWRFLYVQP